MKKLSLILLLSCAFLGTIRAADAGVKPQGEELSTLDKLRQGVAIAFRGVGEAAPYAGGYFLSHKTYKVLDSHLKLGAIKTAKAAAAAALIYEGSNRYLNRQTPITNVLGEFGKNHAVAVNGSVLATLLGAAYYAAPVSEEIRDGVLVATGACVLARMATEKAVTTVTKK